MSEADELLRALIWKRFGEFYEQFPWSKEAHLLSCESREIADLAHTDGMALCGTCELVVFTALIWCEHLQVEWEWSEGGRLPWIIADMAELQERSSA